MRELGTADETRRATQDERPSDDEVEAPDAGQRSKRAHRIGSIARRPSCGLANNQGLGLLYYSTQHDSRIPSMVFSNDQTYCMDTDTTFDSQSLTP